MESVDLSTPYGREWRPIEVHRWSDRLLLGRERRRRRKKTAGLKIQRVNSIKEVPRFLRCLPFTGRLRPCKRVIILSPYLLGWSGRVEAKEVIIVCMQQRLCWRALVKRTILPWAFAWSFGARVAPNVFRPVYRPERGESQMRRSK